MYGRAQAVASPGVLLTLVIVIAVLRLAGDVLVPLALSVLLTFLLAPLVGRLRAMGLPRFLAVILAMGLALGLVAGLTDFVVTQLIQVVHQLPGYQTQLHENLTHLRGVLRTGVSSTARTLEEFRGELQRIAPPTGNEHIARVQVVTQATSLEMLRAVVGPLIRPITTGLMVIVLVCFMLLRLSDLRERFIRLIGPRNIHSTTLALDDAAGRVSSYLLFQLLVNCWTGLAFGAGLWALEVPHAGLWGALIALLRFAPYVGVWIGAGLPLALSFAVFDDPTRPLLVVGLIGSIELVNYAAIEPWLFGTHTGVSPIALLLSAVFWAWLWGGVGLLLSVPLTVCLVVMGRHVPQLAFLEVLLGDEPALDPHVRLYQRLLASDRDESEALLEETRKARSMVEVADQAILPALRLAAEECDRGALDEEQRQAMLQAVTDWLDERLDRLDAHGAASADPAARGAPGIVCIPGPAGADRVSAKLLEAALRERGIPARSAQPKTLGDEAPDAAGRLAVLCVFPPEALSRGRLLARELRRAAPRLDFLCAAWHLEGDLSRARERLATVGIERLVTTMAECVQACAEALPAPPPAREAPECTAPAGPALAPEDPLAPIAGAAGALRPT